MNPILEKSHLAGTGGVTQYSAIVLNDAGEAILPGAVNAPRFGGIAQAAYPAGQFARVMKAGISYVKAAAAFKPGKELIIADNTGAVQEVGSTAATVYNIVAISEEEATAAGDIVLARIAQYTKTIPASA